MIHANTAQKAPNQAEQIRPRSKHSCSGIPSQAGYHLPVSFPTKLALHLATPQQAIDQQHRVL